MSEPVTLWSIFGAAVGIAIKSLWDSYIGTRDKIKLETWKIKISEIEQRLSAFYWPLHSSLRRDDVVWKKVYFDLYENNSARPSWTENLSREDRARFRTEIENKVIIPNHIQAADIIRSKMHLANADKEFSDMLIRYTKHVDVYISMRAAGIHEFDPIHVDEPFPEGLSKAVEDRLLKYQNEYESLLRDKGIVDLS